MLGRLKMEIDECIKTYNYLMEIIFDVGAWKKRVEDWS